MSSFAPLPQSLEQVGVHLRIASFRTDRSVVGCPASDEGIEMLNQGCLWQYLVPLDRLFEGLRVNPMPANQVWASCCTCCIAGLSGCSSRVRKPHCCDSLPLKLCMR